MSEAPSRPFRLAAGLDRVYARLAGAAAAVTPRAMLMALGVALLVASAGLPWITTPLQGRLPGYAIPLAGPEVPRGLAVVPRVASFGSVCVILGLLAVLARRSDRALWYLGSAVVILGAAYFGLLVFRSPDLQQALLVQQRESTRIANFSALHLEGNAAALRGDNAERRGVSERVGIAADATSVDQVGFGSRVTVLGGLLLMAAGGLRGGRRRVDVNMMLLAVALVGGAIAWRCVLAEAYLSRADRQAALMDFDGAAESYATAARWDVSLPANPGYVHRLGAALYQIGRRDRPETHVFLGDNFAGVSDDASALHYYQAAVGLAGDHAVARVKLADALVSDGLDLFRRGNSGSAAVRWRQATDLAPDRVDARFFLAHALFVANREDQREAIAEAEELLSRVADKLVRADLYNMLGDCYSRQGDLRTARLMYRRSMRSFQLIKRVSNFNALIGLQGL